MSRRMHVILTGAAGHTGRHLLRALTSAGHSVTAIARTATAGMSAAEPAAGARWIIQDLSLGTTGLPDDYDAVIHAAAHAPPRSDSPAAHVAHNIVATSHLVEHAARRAGRRFVFLSSLSVYGRIGVPEVDETTPIVSPTSYGLSKLVGEHLVAEKTGKLASVVLRLPGIVGTGAAGPWIERIRTDLAAGRVVRFHSPDAPFNNLVHVDDLTAFVVPLLERLEVGTDTLTLAAQHPLPLRAVIERLAVGAGVVARTEVLPAPQPPFTISSDRAIRRYGYSPSTVADLVDRLRSTPRPDPS